MCSEARKSKSRVASSELAEFETLQYLVLRRPTPEMAPEQGDGIDAGAHPEASCAGDQSGHVLRGADTTQRDMRVEGALLGFESGGFRRFCYDLGQLVESTLTARAAGPEYRGAFLLREGAKPIERQLESRSEVRIGKCHQETITPHPVNVAEKSECDVPIRRRYHLARQSTLDCGLYSRRQCVSGIRRQIDRQEQSPYLSHHSPTMARRRRWRAAVAA